MVFFCIYFIFCFFIILHTEIEFASKPTKSESLLAITSNISVIQLIFIKLQNTYQFLLFAWPYIIRKHGLYLHIYKFYVIYKHLYYKSELV